MADRYYSSRQCSDYILILADLFINILLRYSIIAPESLFPLFELFDNLCSLVKYLNLSADDIFYPDSAGEKTGIQKLSMLLNGCSEQEVEMLIPAVRYLLSLMRQQDNCQ